MATPDLRAFQMAAYPVAILVARDEQVFLRHTAMTVDEVREALAPITSSLRVPPQGAIRTWHAAYDRPTDQDIEVVVPLVSQAGPTGIGLLVRVTLTEHGTHRPEAVRFVDAFPTEAELVAYESAKKPPPPVPSTAPPPERVSPVPARWRPVIANVVHRLAVGDYAGLARDGVAPERAGPRDLGFEHWVKEYPYALVDLPEEAWAFTHHEPTDEDGLWSLSVELWTAEEGRSDLTLEGFVREDGASVTVRIDRIQVL